MREKARERGRGRERRKNKSGERWECRLGEPLLLLLTILIIVNRITSETTKENEIIKGTKDALLYIEEVIF